jgi:hypothetical protein
MTKYAYGHGTPYNASDVYTTLDSGTNDLKTALQTFYTNEAGSDTKTYTVPYVSPLPDMYDSPNASYATTGEGGKSHPNTSGTAAKNGSNAVFVLSITEATTYETLDTPAERTTKDAATKSSGRDWWLRSPGISATYGCSHITGGNVSYYPARGNDRDFRPALWIKS